MCLCIPLTSCFYVNQTKEADKILECDFPVTIRNRLKEFNKINQVNLYKFNNPLVKLATNEFFICIKYPKYNSCKNYLIKKPFTNTSTLTNNVIVAHNYDNHLREPYKYFLIYENTLNNERYYLDFVLISLTYKKSIDSKNFFEKYCKKSL